MATKWILTEHLAHAQIMKPLCCKIIGAQNDTTSQNCSGNASSPNHVLPKPNPVSTFCQFDTREYDIYFHTMRGPHNCFLAIVRCEFVSMNRRSLPRATWHVYVNFYTAIVAEIAQLGWTTHQRIGMHSTNCIHINRPAHLHISDELFKYILLAFWNNLWLSFISWSDIDFQN